jgi:uncharacterized protein YraI
MNRIGLGVTAAAAALFALPSAASALTAITTEPVALRAGPANDFPVVDRVPDDARVTVHGCVRAYRWCDVSWRDAHGWIRGENLAYFYQQRRVSIVEYGPRLSLPIIAFSVDRYWDRYYRSRPFYSERARWRTVWRDEDVRTRGDTRVDRRVDRRDERTERRDTRADRTERRDTRADRQERLRDQRGYRSFEQERTKSDRRDADRSNRDSSRGMRERTDRGDRDSGARERNRPEANLREQRGGVRQGNERQGGEVQRSQSGPRSAPSAGGQQQPGGKKGD